MTIKAKVLNVNKNRFRIPIRRPEYQDGKLNRSVAVNILRRSDLRHELVLAETTFPSTEGVSEGTLVSAREILEAVDNHAARKLLRALASSPGQEWRLEEPFFIREKRLTRSAALEIFNKRNDVRKTLGIKLHKKETDISLWTKGLTDILVAAQAPAAARQIYIGWANNLARIDALAALNLMANPKQRS